MDLAELRIPVDTKDIERASKELEKLKLKGKAVQGSTNSVSQGFNKVGGAANKATRPIKNTNGALDSLADKFRNAAVSVQLIEGPLGGTASRLIAFSNVIDSLNLKLIAFVGAATAIGLVFGVLGNQGVMAAEQLKKFDAQLQLALKSTDDLADARQKIVDISIATGTALQDSVGTLRRVQVGATALGKGTDESLKLLELVQKLGAIGNVAPTQLSAGLLQFGQALSGNIVRAEEFNSLIENMPDLANAIAEGLGKSTGELRKLVIDGKLLSEDVFKSLIGQEGKINELFSSIPRTIDIAKNKLEIVFAFLSRDIDKTFGLTDKVIAGIDAISGSLVFVKDNLRDIVFLAEALGTSIALVGAGSVFPTITSSVLSFGKSLIDSKKALDFLNATMKVNNGYLLAQSGLLQGLIDKSKLAAGAVLLLRGALVGVGLAIGALAIVKLRRDIEETTGVTTDFEDIVRTTAQALTDPFNDAVNIAAKALSDFLGLVDSFKQSLADLIDRVIPAGTKGLTDFAVALSRVIGKIVSFTSSFGALQSTVQFFAPSFANFDKKVAVNSLVRQLKGLDKDVASKVVSEDVFSNLQKGIFEGVDLKGIQNKINEAREGIGKNTGIVGNGGGGETKESKAAKALKKLTERRQEFFATLEREIGQQKLLNAANLESEDAYNNQKIAIEALNKVLQANLQLSNEETIIAAKRVEDLIRLEEQEKKGTQQRKLNADISKLVSEATSDFIEKTQEEARARSLKDQVAQLEIERYRELLAVVDQGAGAIDRVNTKYDALIENVKEITESNKTLADVQRDLNNEADISAAKAPFLTAQEKLEQQKNNLKNLESAVQQYGRTFENAFFSQLRQGQLNFKEFTFSILEDIGRMILRMTILSSLFGGTGLAGQTKQGLFPKIFSGIAKSTGFVGGITSKPFGFAKGGVINRPTALGPDVVGGERGDEGVLPLKRMSNGDLGVQSSGVASSGSNFYNTINVSVEGRSSGKGGDSDEKLAQRIGIEVSRNIKNLVADELKDQTRIGNMLNPGVKIGGGSR